MPQVRDVKEVQLSGGGYRKNPGALDPARALWKSEDSVELTRLVNLYDHIATKVRKSEERSGE